MTDDEILQLWLEGPPGTVLSRGRNPPDPPPGVTGWTLPLQISLKHLPDQLWQRQ